ncbi:MAG: FMN-binding negative transcriptional regulator [Gammaproteobacteria bacterium]
MTVYIPRHFEGDDATARQLIADFPFAILVTGGAAGVHVTHLPLLLDGDALLGHVARPNPHWQAFAAGATVAVFQGPHAFVSRGWYRDPVDNVPTWNYAAVHVTGRPLELDAAGTRAAVERLAARFEPPALPAIAEKKMGGLLKGIVAFRMPIERLEVKFKMSQNKPAEVAGVIAGLKATGRHDELATALWMERKS